MVLDAISKWVWELGITVATATSAFVADLKRNQVQHQKDIKTVTSELEIDSDGATRLEEIENRQDAYDRMLDRQERYFVGDGEDPSQPGLLEEVHEISENQQEIRKTVQEIQEDLKHDER